MTNMEFFTVMMSFLSPIAVGLFINSGVKTQIKANESNISKQVKEELEKEKALLDEKIRIKREDRLWHLKFDLLVEIQNQYSESVKVFGVFDATEIKEFNNSIYILMIKCRAIFDSENTPVYLSDIPSKMESASDETPKQIGRLFRSAIEEVKTELGFA